MTGLLDGDTAVVTGAASGIGRGNALALAQEGARLVVTDVLSGGPAPAGTAFLQADLA